MSAKSGWGNFYDREGLDPWDVRLGDYTTQAGDEYDVIRFETCRYPWQKPEGSHLLFTRWKPRPSGSAKRRTLRERRGAGLSIVPLFWKQDQRWSLDLHLTRFEPREAVALLRQFWPWPDWPACTSSEHVITELRVAGYHLELQFGEGRPRAYWLPRPVEAGIDWGAPEAPEWYYAL